MAKPRESQNAPPIWQRLGWFGAIWLASVAALFVVAMVLRWAVKVPT